MHIYNYKQLLAGNNNSHMRAWLKSYHKACKRINDKIHTSHEKISYWLKLGDLNYYQSQHTHLKITEYRDQADRMYIRGLKVFNQHKKHASANDYDNAGMCCYHLHLFHSAELYYQNAVNMDGNQAKYWSHLGELNLVKKPKSSVASFENATELAPKNGLYYKQLGDAYSQLHDYTEAAHATNLAKIVNPKMHVSDFGQSSLRYDPNIDYTQHLNQMIGLDSVKRTLKSIINQAIMFKIRSGKPGHSQIHLLFEGNPGTGKTSVADLLCGILYQKHVIDKYKFVKVNGTQMTTHYFGGGPEKVRKLIKKAMGGVLFIDEAYQLAHLPNGNSALQDEAVREFIPDIEQYKDNLVVIMAGYTKQMENFVNHSNPGLKSRFPIASRIDFPDYKPDECWKIFNLYLKNHHFNIRSTEARKMMKAYMTKTCRYMTKNHTFANARTIRNIYGDLIHAFSDRMLAKYSFRQLRQLKKQGSSKLNNISIKDVRKVI